MLASMVLTQAALQTGMKSAELLSNGITAMSVAAVGIAVMVLGFRVARRALNEI